MPRRLCSRAPDDGDLAVGVGQAPVLGHGDRLAPGQEPAGERGLVLHQPLDRPRVHDVAAVLAGAGADVDDPVGRGDGVLVVLDDDQGVAEVAQPGQRGDQPPVVALVQADARLVEHVEHPDQAGADLGGEPDPLRLAAGQRAGGAVEGEVVEADVEQEAEAGVDLLEHRGGDLGLARVEGQLTEELGALPHRQRADLGDRLVADPDGQHLGLEPGAAAGRARHLAHVALVPLARPVGVGLGVAALDERDDALEAAGVRPLAAEPVPVPDVHLVVLAAQQRVLGPRRQRPPRDVHREAELVGQAGHQPVVVLVAALGVAPRRDRALAEGEVLVGHDQLVVDLEPDADARAGLARPVGRVERERARLDLVELQRVVVRAGHLLAEAPLAARVVGLEVDQLGGEQAAGQPEGGLDRVGEPPLGARLHGQAVDHDVDGVLELLLQRGRAGERDHLAVDPGAGEALALQLGEQVGVLALAAAHDRREHLEPGALGHGHQPVDDLLRGLPADRLVADRAVRHARAGPEQAQVVVDLGDGADRGARVAAGGLLVDRDRGRQALDEVDVGLVHLPEELARVGAQRLDVAALALGEDRVERERGLARAGQPGEHHEGVARQVEVDVLEVVLAGAAHHQLVRRGAVRGRA